ncbi:PFL_4669 family integrating conjugative element protein [Serratia sp. JSRIV006]|uniref:PFL_4669 family integrating conjugative element protein n=1 Tax=Serratia sp. JSRIV006 TaxID=2831896 RepID=UPI001CBAE829|nr:TIGR03761 family integrating conjugative element protein [Serratia sp. JSRIV006]UAN63367.1 TIGR03761 family integrating conjugative element protein [Serratia sp. JSRIV006]
MAEDKTMAPSAAAKAGALKSSLSIELHSHYAIRLWEGRKRADLSPEKRKRPEILSMPQAIFRAGIATRDSAADNPYADAVLLKLEQILALSTDKVQQYVRQLEEILKCVPCHITLGDIASLEPLNISVYSRSPLGYRCVWLLVGYDQLALKAFQAFHYGLISRSQRDRVLSDGGYAVRRVYGVIQPYKTINVTRHDILTKTLTGLDAIERLGEPEPDVMSGKQRSSFSPPLPDADSTGRDISDKGISVT